MASSWEPSSSMVFIRNWVEEVRDLASNWNSEGQSKLAGDDLEFQAGYLGSLLDLVWEDVREEDDALSIELSSYMTEMANWISKVHVQRHSAKKDVLVPLKSSTMVCNGAPASPSSQVFDEMLEPINDSEMSLNSPELLPEAVHNQPEVQTEGYDASIFSSKISISAPTCPSSSLSSTTTFRSKDPIDLESIIQNSLSIYEAHSAIKTENNGLLSAGEAFTFISTLDGVSPFLKVNPCFLVATEDTTDFSVTLVAFSKASIRCLIESVEPSSPDFVNSPTASYVLDTMPSREFQLFPYSCTLMDSVDSCVDMAENLVFDPGGFKTIEVELLVALGAHDLFVELPQRDALWSIITDWTFMLDSVLEFIVVHFPYDRGKCKLFMSPKDASEGLLMEFLGLSFHLDHLEFWGVWLLCHIHGIGVHLR